MKTQTLDTTGNSRSLSTSCGWKPLGLFRQSVRALLLAVVGFSLLGGNAEAKTIKKQTRFVNLSGPTAPVKNGTRVTLRAQFTYRDKQRNWVYLGYTSVPVTFVVAGRNEGTVNTNKADGYATLSVVLDIPRVGKRGKNVKWIVSFPGDNELNRPLKGVSSFTVLP